MNKLLLLFLVTALVISVSYGQPCNIPPVSELCEEAPLFCNVEELDGYCTTLTTNQNGNGPSPLCPQGGEPHNAVWFAFSATCTSFEMTLNPSNCSGTGMQAAIYSYGPGKLCWDSYSLPEEYIACLTVPCFTTSQTFTVAPLIVGQVYYMILDGCSGDLCDVAFSINTPCEDPLVIEPWAIPIQGSTYSCSGSTTTYWVQKPLGTFNLNWVLDGNDIQIAPDSIIDITWTTAGTYELCVSATHPCVQESDGPAPICITIEIYDIIPVDPPPVLICAEDNYLYNEVHYPCGVHDILLVTPAGCDSTVTLVIECIENVINDLGVIPVCEGEVLPFMGNLYTCDHAGNYEITFPSPDFPFCDSIVRYELACISSHINGPLTLSGIDTIITLDGHINAPGYTVFYNWSTIGGVLPDSINQPTLLVRDTGQYCLSIEVYTPDSLLYCSDISCVAVTEFICNTPAATDNCENAPILCSIDELNGYCTSMSPVITGNGPSPLCAQGGAPHNTLWFAFYAACESLDLKIIPTNCVTEQGNLGIQAAIYGYNGNDGICTNSNLTPDVEVACYAAPCFTSAQTLVAQNLVVGNIYYILIDGCSGSYCDIEIVVESPCNAPTEIADWSQNIQGPTSVCAGKKASYQMPMPMAANSLSWYMDGVIIHHGREEQIVVDIPSKASFELCVDASNLCVPESASPLKNCITVQINPSVESEGRTYYTCQGGTVIHQGVYWSCAEAGTQKVIFQQKESPYCDSIYSFEVICMESEALIASPDPITPQVPEAFLDGSASISSGPVTEFLWEASNGGVLKGPIDQPFAIAIDTGTYCLTVKTMSPNKAKICTSTACVAVMQGRSTPILDDVQKNAHYRIWPQPVSDLLLVEYKGKSALPESHVVIRNISGAEVQRKKWNPSGDQMEISTRHLIDGVYTILVIQENGKIDFMDKLIVIH